MDLAQFFVILISMYEHLKSMLPPYKECDKTIRKDKW